MLHHTKGVKSTFRQHVVDNQKTYASNVTSQNTLPQPKTTNETFTLTAKQLTKFVANVVIQIAQPQVCYPNPKQDILDLTSMCRKVSNAAKTILNVDIIEKGLFESTNRFSQRPCSPLSPSHSRVPKSSQSPKPSQKHPQC